MTIGDYAALVKAETSFGKPAEHGPSQDFVGQFTHGVESLQMQAVRDFPTEAGRFPIIVYAPSLNAPNTENIELCEYLASHGYVVLSSPSLGAATRRMLSDAAGAEAQFGDIAFLIRFAKALPDAEAEHVALIGYSWGATAALLVAARDKSIAALVALDGSFLYGPIPASDVHPEQMTVPLLVFSRGEEPIFPRQPGVLGQTDHYPGRVDPWRPAPLGTARNVAHLIQLPLSTQPTFPQRRPALLTSRLLSG